MREMRISEHDQIEIVRLRSLSRRSHRRLVPRNAPKSSREEVGLEILRTISESHVGKVGVVAIPTGAGKTRALAIISTSVTDIAIFFESYARLDEFVKARDAYIENAGIKDAARVVIRKGVMRACAYKDKVEKMRAERNVRSEVCGHCDLRVTCEAHAVAARGEVLLAVHASHASLRNEGSLTGRVVVFDEAPVEFTTTTWSHEDASHSRANAGSAKRQVDARAIAHVARSIETLLDSASNLWVMRGKPEHGLHISHAQLLEMITSNSELNVSEIHTALEHLEAARARRTMAGAPDPMFTRLTLFELRVGRRKVAHRRGIEDLWDALRVMLLVPTNDADTTEKERLLWERGELSASVAGDGVAKVELRRRRRLAVSPGGEGDDLDLGCVILSATGALHVDRIRALDRACDVQLVGIDVSGTAPHDRVHVVSASVSRSHLIARGELRRNGTRPAVWKRTLSATRAALEVVEEKRGEGIAAALRERVGILTFLGVRDRLDSDEGWKAAQELAGVRVLVHGHYGLDDVGSNEYLRQDVRMLLTLGHPTWHIGSIEADARFLGIDPAQLARDMATERLAQSEGRLRAGWDREGEAVVTVHVHVGPEAPDHWSEGSYRTVWPSSQHESNLSLDGALSEAISLECEPVSISDKNRVLAIVNRVDGGSSVRKGVCAAGSIRESSRDPAAQSGNTPTVIDRFQLVRALKAAGWVNHPVRSSPVKTGRPSTWAPPDWNLDQVQAWASERLAARDEVAVTRNSPEGQDAADEQPEAF
jgi:hypothetical protein